MFFHNFSGKNQILPVSCCILTSFFGLFIIPTSLQKNEWRITHDLAKFLAFKITHKKIREITPGQNQFFDFWLLHSAHCSVWKHSGEQLETDVTDFISYLVIEVTVLNLLLNVL